MVKSFSDIARAWREYGKSYARYPSLWDSSLVLATLGPQTGGGVTARDFSGRNNHGTLTGATHLPTWTHQTYRGRSFRGVTFDGTEDYIGCQSTDYGCPFTTVSWGIQSSDLSAPNAWYLGTLFGKADDVSANMWSLGFYSSDKMAGSLLAFAERGDGYAAPGHWVAATTAAGAVKVDTPYCLCLVSPYAPWNSPSNIEFHFYIDGSYIATGYNPSSFTATSGKQIRIGTSTRAAPYDYSLRGTAGSTFLYTRVLTSAEISILGRHPLAAYETVRPKYFIFYQTTPTLYYKQLWLKTSQNKFLGLKVQI